MDLTIDLNNVVVFVQVVTAGSFVGAAKQLNLPTTTVSRRVAQLEQSLGTTLLQRTTRKLNLTDVGAIYFERCRRIVQDMEETNLAVTSLQAVPHGTLRLTATEGFGNAILNPWLLKFLHQYPQIKVEVLFSNSYVDLIEAGIDVGFRLGVGEDSSLVKHLLGEITYWLCASPDYLNRMGSPSTPAHLSHHLNHHSCIVVGPPTSPGRWTLSRQSADPSTDASSNHSIAVSGRVKVNSIRLAEMAVLAGMGIAPLPAYLVRPHLDTGHLMRVLPDYYADRRGIWIVYPSQRYLAPKVQTLVEFVRNQATIDSPW